MVQSVERAFSVLAAVALAPAGITDLSARVNLPKSTVARILATLEELRAVERTVGGGYRIGVGLIQLAGAADGAGLLQAAVAPHLSALAESLGEAAGFSVPNGYEVHYLAQVESPNPVQVRDYSGLKLPMHVGPSGLCMMSRWSEAELSDYLARPLQAFTDKTVVEPKRIKRRLTEVRAEGHCWVFEEFAQGLNSVAAPVLDPSGVPLGAIHVHGPAYRFPNNRADDIAQEVMSAAERFSANSPSKNRSAS